MPLTRFPRALALSAAIATLAAAIVAIPAVGGLPAPSASAATAICYNPIDARYGNLHTSMTPNPIDDGVAVYAEGDFTMLTGGQETEGQFIVGGNANYFSHVYSNIGTVGLGSQATPLPGTDVLVTGGNVTVGNGAPPTTVQVSANSSGDIVAGGTISVGTIDTLSYTSGSGTAGAVAPLAPYSDFPADYTLMSSYFASQGTTGSVTIGANDVTFAGNGTSALQVFSVAGTVLGTVGASKALHFTGIPANAIVVVNVTGATASISTQDYVQLNGANLNWALTYAANPAFSNFNQSMMWNFPTATSVTFGDGLQIPGAINAPNADITLLASSNGRVYAGGDITLGGGTQTGLEMHNYAFRGYNCSTTGGSLAITKALSDPTDVVANSRVFTGTYSCTPLTGADITGTWSVAAGATQTVTGLPVGATCSILEDALASPPSAADASYVWGTPTYSAAQVIGDGTTVTITATNSFTRETADFDITKDLDDPDGVVAAGRSFSGTYSCLPQTGTAITGTWSVEVGDIDTVTGIPVGSTCTIVETAPTVAPSADSSYAWAPASYSPASVVVSKSTTVTITAVNTVVQDAGSLDITKTLSDPADIVDNARAFTGTYTCDPLVGADITGTWSVTVGATQTVTGLPAGAICTITETAPAAPSADTSYVWGTTTYSPANGTITTGGTVTLTAQNSFSRQTGSFAITKALTDPDAVVTPGRDFTGTYTCDPQSGADLTGSWSVEAGQIQTVANVPLGSICTIVEDTLTAPSADPNYSWGAPTYSPSTVTTTGGTVTITATNTVTQGTGSFTIEKVLAGTSSVVTAGRHFTGTYSCATGSTPITGSWDVTTTAPQTITGIPAGASCTISETLPLAAPSSTDSSYVWDAPTYSPSAAAITAGGSVTITATNTVRRGLGHLELVKVLDDPFNVVSLARVYTGTFQCIHNTADITPAPGTWSTTAGAPAITLATNLPAGTVCTVAEDALTVPPLVGYPQYIWRAPSYSPTTITIVDNVTGRFTVTNTVFDPFDILAATGTEAGLPLIIGGGAMLAGLLAVLFGYRRRRRSE